LILSKKKVQVEKLSGRKNTFKENLIRAGKGRKGAVSEKFKRGFSMNR